MAKPRNSKKSKSADAERPEIKTNSALGKALAVMRAIVSHDQPISVAELAVRLDIPRQTAHRLVRQLESAGVVARALRRDGYTIGPEMVRLSREILVTSYARDPSHVILQDLVAAIEETCNIGVLDGHRVLYVDRVECNWPLRVQLNAGSHVPIHCTAIGKLLMAYLPSAGRKQLMQGLLLKRFTPFSISDEDELERAVQAIRTKGYSINEEEYLPGIIGLAVPIRDRNGAMIAGLAVHAPKVRLGVDDLLRHLSRLRTAADQLGALVATA